MTTTSDDRRRRLNEYIRRRADDLGLTLAEVAHNAAITTETLRQIRNSPTGHRVRNVRKVDVALEWMPGSIEAIWAGGEPTSVLKDHQAAVLEAYRKLIAAGLAGRERNDLTA